MRKIGKEKSQERQNLIKELYLKYGVDKGYRKRYNKNESWYLNRRHRLFARMIRVFVEQAKSCTITELYKLADLKIIEPNDGKRGYLVMYCVMYLKTCRAIRVRCNNGLKIIKAR